MTASIVRVNGSIIKKPLHRNNLIRFLRESVTPKILVVSTLPEIYNLVNESIEQVFYSGAESKQIEILLHNLWAEHTGNDHSSQYEVESGKLISLLKGIYLTGDYSPALKDAVLSQGEVLTALILARQLLSADLDAAFLHPATIGLTASPDFGNSTFTAISPEKVNQLSSDKVWVFPGSFGITAGGKIARAGKSAADYTAAFLVGETNSERLVLWGAGKGFYAADHSIVPEAKVIERLTYSEASELAYFDHFTLHPRTVEPLIRKHVPIHFIHAEGPGFEPVTIINTENFTTPRVVKSVACTDDISILKLNGPGVGLKPGILARITGKLAEASVNIKSVITSQVSINILLDSKSGRQAKKVANELGFTAVSEIELLEEVSLIAIVGHGMQSSYGISAKLFGAVAQNHINVILSGSGASDLVSYLLVHSSDRDKSVKAIYQAFFSS
jgi:aspartate kinase/aspartokinase/homoserine dehydrogenase 1